MKMRIVYLVVRDMDLGIKFWSTIFKVEHTKYSPFWSEFKIVSPIVANFTILKALFRP